MKRMRDQQGFTFLEIAIVLIVTGVFTVMSVTATLAIMQKIKIKDTRTKLEIINQSIQEYYIAHNAYPCPAPRDLPIQDPAAAISVNALDAGSDPDPVENDCILTPRAGTDRVTSVRTPAYDPPDDPPYTPTVRIGAVPTRTLNLPDEFIADGWGSRFTYAVTEEQTSAAKFNPDAGGISIVDSLNNSVVQPPDTAHYIVISHGPDRFGSNNYIEGTFYQACAPGAALDDENCELPPNSVFRKTILSTGATGLGPEQFDDHVIFGAQIEPVQLFPTGAVIPFDIGSDLSSPTVDPCPPGWTRYTNADERRIVGADNTAANYDFGDQGGSDNATIPQAVFPSHTHSITISDFNSLDLPIGVGLTVTYTNPNVGTTTFTGSQGADPAPSVNIRNKYIALLYCRKD